MQTELIHEADDLQKVVNGLRIRALCDPEIDRLRLELEGMNARWFRVCTELVGPDEPRPMFDDVEGMIEMIRGLRWRNRMCFKLADLVNKLSEKLNSQHPHHTECGECGGTGEIINDGPYSACDDCNGTVAGASQMNEATDILNLFMYEWRGDAGPNREAIVFDPHF